MQMKDKSTGFSLIELIIVIAVIAVLAAFVIPRFLNLNKNAQIAATTSVASALTAANASNYAIRSLNAQKGQPIRNCTDVGLLNKNFPKEYTIVSETVEAGDNEDCTLLGPNSTQGNFIATGIK